MANIYAYPNETDITGTVEIFRWANTVSDGILFPIILLVLWFITFISTIRAAPKSVAMTVSSFLTAMTAIMFVMLNLLAQKYMYLSFVVCAFGVAWMLLENRD